MTVPAKWLLCILVLCMCGRMSADVMKGMIYTCWSTGGYSTPSSDQSLKEMTTGTDSVWSSVVWTYFQPNTSATYMSPLQYATPSEADIRHFAATARSLGQKIVIKPHVDVSDGKGTFRGDIGQNFNQAQWNEWFGNYRNFINYAAGVAQSLNAELFIVGTELSSSEPQSDLWRQTIAGVRKIYFGPIVYGANFVPFNISWWDALDYIGVDAYFPLTQNLYPSVNDLVSGWGGPSSMLQGVANKFGKKVIFTEIGYQSKSDAGIRPYGGSGSLDLTTQANCYQAYFNAIYNQGWVAGVFWWAWGIDPNAGGPSDSDYTPKGKPAQNIVQQNYGGGSSGSSTSGSSSSGSSTTGGNTPITVYSNGQLGNGWQDWSWSGQINLQSSDTAPSGDSYSLKANMNSGGTVSLHHDPLYTSGYSSFILMISGTSDLSNLVAFLYDQNGNAYPPVPLSNYGSSTSGWQTITIPLSALQVPSQLSRVDIGVKNAVQFYLNEIYLK